MSNESWLSLCVLEFFCRLTPKTGKRALVHEIGIVFLFKVDLEGCMYPLVHRKDKRIDFVQLKSG